MWGVCACTCSMRLHVSDCVWGVWDVCEYVRCARCVCVWMPACECKCALNFPLKVPGIFPEPTILEELSGVVDLQLEIQDALPSGSRNRISADALSPGRQVGQLELRGRTGSSGQDGGSSGITRPWRRGAVSSSSHRLQSWVGVERAIQGSPRPRAAQSIKELLLEGRGM